MKLEREYATWTHEENQLLLQRFEAGCDIRTLCFEHQRTPAAITTQLQRLGRLVEMRKAYYPVGTAPWVTFKQVNELAAELRERKV